MVEISPTRTCEQKLLSYYIPFLPSSHPSYHPSSPQIKHVLNHQQGIIIILGVIDVMSVTLCVCVCVFSVLSDSLGPHGLSSTRLLCPWNSPGKNTGLGCHFLLQGIFPSQGSNLRLLMSPALAEGIFTPSAGSKTSPLHTQESVPVQGPHLLQAVPHLSRPESPSHYFLFQLSSPQTA